MIINDFEKISPNINILQIEQWSILSKVINNVQHNRNAIDYSEPDVRVLEPKSNKRMNDK